MEQVSANVYAETGLGGCNPGFVTTGEGIVMIDSPQIPSDAVRWRDEMETKGEIQYIINTEPHRDHIAGNFFFPGKIISHQGTREEIATFTKESIIDRIKNVCPEDMPLMEGYFLKKPHITFTEELTLYMGDHTFELISLPGHTVSQIAVYIPQERVVFTGDNIFHKVQTWFKEAVPFEWLQSLKRIAQLEVDAIVPGHGTVCGKDYIKEQASFIEEWIETVKDAVSQGIPKEEAIKKISFLDRYPMDVGLEAIGPEVQRMNVDRLYDLLKQH